MSESPEGRAPRRRRSATGRAVVLLVVVAALALTIALPLREWVSQRMEINRLEQSVTDAQARVQELTDEQARWQDPAYVEAQARSRLHFVMPGEIGYVVIGAESVPDQVGTQEQQTSWWSGMWDSVRAADAG